MRCTDGPAGTWATRVRGTALVASVLLLESLLLLVSLAGCSGDAEPSVTAGVDACSVCNMVIDRVNQACGYVRSGSFVPFDSPGCLLRGYQDLPRQERPAPAEIHFADYRDGSFHSAGGTTFLLTDHIPTVMDGRVLCFGSPAAAAATSAHADEVITDWPGYLTARGTPDRTVEVTIGTGGMEPESVQLEKGDLTEWRISGSGLESDVEFTVQGYPEAGSVLVPMTGEEIRFRLLALRPGAGFPIRAGTEGEILGRLRVAGAHTPDEEVR
jgi:hypothetical protein